MEFMILQFFIRLAVDFFERNNRLNAVERDALITGFLAVKKHIQRDIFAALSNEQSASGSEFPVTFFAGIIRHRPFIKHCITAFIPDQHSRILSEITVIDDLIADLFLAMAEGMPCPDFKISRIYFDADSAVRKAVFAAVDFECVCQDLLRISPNGTET